MRMPETMVIGGPMTKEVYIRADKVLEIIDEESTRNGLNLKQTAEIRRRVEGLKGGERE